MIICSDGVIPDNCNDIIVIYVHSNEGRKKRERRTGREELRWKSNYFDEGKRD